MKKITFILLLPLLVFALAWGVFFYRKNLRGAAPAVREPAEDVIELLPKNTEAPPEMVASGPFRRPAGFSISVFAENLPAARVMRLDERGNMWVSRTRAGAITLVEIKDGKAVSQNDVFRNLKNPHGLVLDPDNPFLLYFAEEHRISKVSLYSDGAPEKIADLPEGGGHSTRTLLLDKAGKLLVSIGSSCNVCVEKDERRAAVWSLDRDGSNFQVFAKGLRNSVFLAVHPETGKIWATEMGRDLLGDDVPPDELNILEAGKDYGWPYCYGKNIHDDVFDSQNKIACQDKAPAFFDFQAHSAPLGLAFIPENSAWPEDYWNDLLVSFHGSWNRSVPTGYKIVRMKLDRAGNFEGLEDFVTGFLPSGAEALGRPVDILIDADGSAFVSDDKAGVIYKIEYRK